MKISAVSIVNNNKLTNRNAIKDNKNTVNNINQTDLMKNSLSEAIGRSQVVSFTGILDKFVNHYYKKRLGLGGSEHIMYDTKSGNFTYTNTRLNGSLKSKEEYNPQLGKQIITTSDKNGTTKVTTTTHGVYTEKKDAQNREVLYEEKLYDGHTYREITEYSKHRRIVEQLYNGKRQSIKVIDIRTNTPVDSGDIVKKEVNIPEKGIKRVKNILTDAIYSEEKRNQYGRLIYRFENFPETNIHSFKRVYNKKTGGYDEITYKRNGNKTKIKMISKNERNIEQLIFDEDGETVLKHFENIYDRHRELVTEIIYNGASKNIDTLTDFYNNGRTEVYFYKRNPNVPEYAEYYKSKFKVMDIDYQDDGYTYKHTVEYLENNEIHETDYYESGKPKIHSKIDASGFVYEESQYYSNGKIHTYTKFNKKDGSCIQEIYENGAKFPKEKITQDNTGNIREIKYYYRGTNKEKEIRIYNDDHSYRQILRDFQGKIISDKECYPNGREKKYKTEENSRNNNSYSSNTKRRPFTFFTIDFDESKSTKKTPDDESLNNILNILVTKGRYISEISDNDWQVLSRLTGVDDIESLKKMDTKTYRPLAKKFHPDVNKDNPNINQCNTIMLIINALYERNKK